MIPVSVVNPNNQTEGDKSYQGGGGEKEEQYL